ncbi:hypothetical protein ACLBYG_20735 [Methylobacterium sp. D53M]
MAWATLSTALAATFLSASVVIASDDAELEQVIRSASRFEAIARVCPTLIPTDVSRARTYGSVYMKAAERFASDRVAEMMPTEIKRRVAEVEITGEQRWCEDQRRYLHEMGAGDVFPVARPRTRR